ncbi:MAG: hypothetical protein K9M13_02105, partial [Simkaniaceae bacterium]|nr:hypothetical protein [Simkaniaceae bacterium]
TLALCPKSFAKRMQSPPPPWMLKRIEQDLNRYRNEPISRRKLDSTYLQLQSQKIARFQISYSQLNYQTTCQDHIRFKAMKKGLETLCQLYPKLNIDFIVSLEDDMKGIDSPIFVFAKHRYNSHQILIPDFTCFASKTTSYAWTHRLMPKIMRANEKIHWEEKINRCLWRGGATGIDFVNGNYAASPRCKACTLSELYPEFLDARFTDAIQVPKPLKDKFLDQFHIASFLTPEAHLKYKYLICLDGNACTYPGLHWRLLSNSVVLKPDSSSIQWYYEGLIPDYHYISIEKDMADLILKLKWAQDHDEKAHQIADNATQFAQDNLSLEAILQYLCLLLQEYEKVCNEQNEALDLYVYKDRVIFSY